MLYLCTFLQDSAIAIAEALVFAASVSLLCLSVNMTQLLFAVINTRARVADVGSLLKMVV